MGRGPSAGLLMCSIVAASFLGVTIASAQSPLAAKLSPEVREYVKFDDDVIALSHVRVIDGTGQASRSDQTLIVRNGAIEAVGNASSTPVLVGAKVLNLPIAR